MDQSTEPSVSTGRLRAASPVAVWAGLFTLYFVWGSTYIGIKVSVETIPPFLMASIRFLIAGSFLLAWEVIATHRLRTDPTVPPDARPRMPSRREWRDSAIVGGALLFGGMGMVALGEKTVSAGVAAILIALLPVWVAVFGRLFFGERLPVAAVVGIVVGLAGVILLVGPFATGGDARLDPFGVLCLLISPMFWGAGSLYSSHLATLPRRPLTATGLQMICGGLLLGLGALLTGEVAGFDPAAVSTRSLAALVYLTTIGSLVGFTTYVWLLRVAPLPRIATYAYVNPVVAFVLAGLLLGETIEPRTVIAGAIIVFAVALIVTARARVPGTAHPRPDGAVADEPSVGDDPSAALAADAAGAGSARPLYPD